MNICMPRLVMSLFPLLLARTDCVLCVWIPVSGLLLLLLLSECSSLLRFLFLPFFPLSSPFPRDVQVAALRPPLSRTLIPRLPFPLLHLFLFFSFLFFFVFLNIRCRSRIRFSSSSSELTSPSGGHESPVCCEGSKSRSQRRAEGKEGRNSQWESRYLSPSGGAVFLTNWLGATKSFFAPPTTSSRAGSYREPTALVSPPGGSLCLLCLFAFPLLLPGSSVKNTRGAPLTSCPPLPLPPLPHTHCHWRPPHSFGKLLLSFPFQPASLILA